jgi:hypothetical protein
MNISIIPKTERKTKTAVLNSKPKRMMEVAVSVLLKVANLRQILLQVFQKCLLMIKI